MAKSNELFPYCISDDLGEITAWERQCPGVFYVAAATERGAAECYLAERDAGCVSDEAKAYGIPLSHHPALLVYNLNHPL